jgi:hypothetical protein
MNKAKTLPAAEDQELLADQLDIKKIKKADLLKAIKVQEQLLRNQQRIINDLRKQSYRAQDFQKVNGKDKK